MYITGFIYGHKRVKILWMDNKHKNNSTVPESIQGNPESKPENSTMPAVPSVRVDTDHVQEDQLKKKIYKAKDIAKLAAVIIAPIVAVFVMFTYVAGITVVDGISMRPTLKTGDVLLVWKLPKTIANLTHSQYLPSRSKVVIVTEPNDPKIQLVKRVIALPDESVTIKDGKILVINKDYPNGFYPDDKPYGAKLPVTSGDFQFNIDAGQVFVMGDNRNSGASIDSRSSVGGITSSNIVGEVLLRIYPFNRYRTL